MKLIPYEQLNKAVLESEKIGFCDNFGMVKDCRDAIGIVFPFDDMAGGGMIGISINCGLVDFGSGLRASEREQIFEDYVLPYIKL